ncbi:hypothetical protein LAZ67_1000788 [Cordylochernes scorpioides]|uniref:RNase H type-1 domain-containing protein n=1 Tax=Cordylochernes scorpioides TaxID=51811 RepID=A0ABY6JUY0_9ARAC|nr:hypothetical protein LAZ67_1000788 [Cordylochernes scorpioides]
MLILKSQHQILLSTDRQSQVDQTDHKELEELEEWNFMEKPTAIYTDSQSLINWISSPKQSSRCRHINRKYHFLRDCYESRDICLLYKPSQHLEADIFTEDLSRDQMKKHLENLSIVGIKTKQGRNCYADFDFIIIGADVTLLLRFRLFCFDFSLACFYNICNGTKLLAIEKGLTECKNSNKNIRILSDSISVIQHIKDIDSAKDKTTTKIIKILKKISQENQITFQWIPSHVNIDGNEMADQLAKEGCKGQPENSQLTYSKISSIHKQKIISLWKSTLNHPWYTPIPNIFSFHTLTREEQMAISRLQTGHLRMLKFNGKIKTFQKCPKCDSQSASPEHL